MLKSWTDSSMMRAVTLPTIVALALLSLLLGAVLHVSTSRSDAFALGQQEKLIRLAVSEARTTIAKDQEASTYWDDAVTRVHQRPLDLAWIDNNLGVWFYTYYKHDETYLLDTSDRPIYAMQNGIRGQPASFDRVSKEVLQLAATLRHALRTNYIAPEGSVGQTIGTSAITMIGKRPAIISLKPIVSETGTIAQTPGSEYLHVSIRFLDRSFLAQISSVYSIEKPAFSTTKDIASVPLVDGNGRTLGFINWHPFEPGDEVEDKMVPALFLALLTVGALLGWLLSRIWRSRTELEASKVQAQHLAFHDVLTGLPNRALFEDRLDHALSRRDNLVAVLLLDLDRFKNINDTLGHQAGDALIRDFGLRLSALVRDGDTIARLGGDEFAIIIEQGNRPEIERLARRIVEDVRRPFELLGTQAYVGVSVGIALSQGKVIDRLELIRRADIALYCAKDEGRDDYRIFSHNMDATVKLRSAIEDELRDALSTGKGLCVHYQPQVGANGNVIGLEALVRWQHPKRGLVSPEQFVPVAEDTGLIVPLGEWVLRQACLASRRWPNLFIAVNLSPVQFRSAAFFDRLMRLVRTTGADPTSLQLEVTERVLLDDDDAVREVLNKLRGAGFTIVLDDFGTGYSSLSYLRKFEVDKLKIDRSFVQHLGDASDSAAIISAVLALGRAMGLAVAAEGVETAEQQRFLMSAGCKEMQGYLFSEALPQDELAHLLGPCDRPAAAA
ncbi:EAL domain-containing protein [Sphingomonas flavescens]|uniref:bifunctional diguanylate cyclase/phosphodiesterase n=1 Tax=Sphingomonas flavescens TaxID=3132797 RepID=UPI00280409DB|nr:EAL domain-containing protein [Sphingomonas limnosediminicola]